MVLVKTEIELPGDEEVPPSVADPPLEERPYVTQSKVEASSDSRTGRNDSAESDQVSTQSMPSHDGQPLITEVKDISPTSSEATQSTASRGM